MEQVQSLVFRRFAYKLGDYLPKPLKVVYYIVLWATLLYVLFRIIEWTLIKIQVIGSFIFEKRNYWTAVWVLFILAVGSILIAQFWYGLDPFGNTIEWITNWVKGLVPINAFN